MTSSNDDQELIALVDGVDALEARIDTLRPKMLPATGRVGTYFGVLAALTVSLVESAWVVPWIAGTFLVACLPEVRRFVRYRALVRERDELVERGKVQGDEDRVAVDGPAQ